jgi:hypothetical protein
MCIDECESMKIVFNFFQKLNADCVFFYKLNADFYPAVTGMDSLTDKNGFVRFCWFTEN